MDVSLLNQALNGTIPEHCWWEAAEQEANMRGVELYRVVTEAIRTQRDALYPN